MAKKHNVKFKMIELENGVMHATDQNMKKSLRAHFVDGFNGRPFTKKSRHSPSYFAYEKGCILRSEFDRGKWVVCKDGVLRPNREDWSGVDDGMQPCVGGSPTQRIALALMDRRNLGAVKTAAFGWVWTGNIRNEFLQYGTVRSIQVAAAVIKKLAPEGLCRNCELNNEVTPATLPAGDIADDIKEQTRGLCDACRAQQVEQPPDTDAHDSIL